MLPVGKQKGGKALGIAGGKSNARHHHVTFYSSLVLLQQGKTTVALPAQAWKARGLRCILAD